MLLLQWFFLRLLNKEDEIRLHLGVVPLSGFFNLPLRRLTDFFPNSSFGMFLTVLGMFSFLIFFTVIMGESVVGLVRYYFPKPTMLVIFVEVSLRLILGFFLGVFLAKLNFGIKIKKERSK